MLIPSRTTGHTVFSRWVSTKYAFKHSLRRFKSNTTASCKDNGTIKENQTIPTPGTIPPLPLWQRLYPLSHVFSAYGRAQRSNPYMTQVFNSMFIYSIGDMSAQYIRGEGYGPMGTLRSMIIGGVAAIPSYTWFMFLGTSFNYPSKVLSIATKVVVNQAVFTPIFGTYFFGMQSLLSGEGLSEAWYRVKRTVPISAYNACKVWPLVTAFSYTYIQPQYRSLFAGFVAIGWQSYLSWLNQKAAREECAGTLVSAPVQ